MKPKIALTLGSLVLTLAVFLTPNQSLAGIVIDYTYDIETENFFGTNPTAKATLEAAAADISAVLKLNLPAMTVASTDYTFTGHGGNTSATITIPQGYRNPSTGDSVLMSAFSLAENEIRVFAGMRLMDSGILGLGSTIGAGTFEGTIAGQGSASDWDASFASIGAQNNALFRRGDNGPLIRSFRFESSFFGGINDFDMQFGATFGSVGFDLDTNWHFDHTTNVMPGEIDFYKVALHEVLHAVGFGTSYGWDQLSNGSDWLGPEAMALTNGGQGLIVGAHLADGFSSIRLSDGLAQESVMVEYSVNPPPGKHVSLTELDAALLKDIGYVNASAVPEPTSLAMVSILLVGLAAYTRRRNK